MKVGYVYILIIFSFYYYNVEGWLKRYYNYFDDCLNDYGCVYFLGFMFDYVWDKRRCFRNKGFVDVLLVFNVNK